MESNKQYNILVVDDNLKNIQVLGNILREAGYQAGFATDGQQALLVLQKTNNYDLVLLDVDMPVLNGFDTCEALRKDEKTRELPIIFLTAFTDPDSIIKGFELGAQDYITKPFNSKELLARVHTHLILKERTDEVRNLNQNLEKIVEERTQELESALVEMGKLDNIKTGFMTLISQEIRNPLNGIVGAINLIKNQEHSTTIKNLVQTLNESVVRLESFTQKALLSTALSSNTYEIKRELTGLKSLAQFAVIDLNELVSSKNIEVDTGNLPDLSANIDKDLLFKALTITLQNAVENSHRNGSIDISGHEEEGNVILSITDFGEGFSNEIISQVFFPSDYVEDPSGQRTGFSLFIVKQIVEYHKGHISIFNKEHAGGCVELSLPK
jgi:two-component system sensor histidine kinase/response regulator